MNVVVIGGGMVGSLIAEELANDYSVTVIDNNEVRLEKIKKRNHKIKILNLDVNGDAINNIIKNNNLAVNCLPGFMGFKMLEKIIINKVSCVDISFMPENVMDLSGLALENDCVVIPDAGVAPGLSNLIIGNLASKNKINEIQTMVGGLPKEKNPPWNYKAPFSPIDVIEEYTRDARIRLNGNLEIKPALSEKVIIDVEGIGELEAFLTDGLRTLLDSEGALTSVPNLTEYTIRYPGHCDLVKSMIEEGKFSKENIDHTCKELFELWKLNENEEEFTFMLIIATKKNGKEISYTVFDEYTNGWSSMSRTTGLTACALSKLVLEKEIEETGIICPEKIGIENRFYDFVLDYLREKGISIESHN